MNSQESQNPTHINGEDGVEAEVSKEAVVSKEPERDIFADIPDTQTDGNVEQDFVKHLPEPAEKPLPANKPVPSDKPAVKTAHGDAKKVKANSVTGRKVKKEPASASQTLKAVFAVLCGDYDYKNPVSFDDRESKVMYTVRNIAKSPFMLLGILSYFVTAMFILVPMLQMLFPYFSLVSVSFQGVIKNPSQGYLMELARSLLAVAAIAIIVIPVFLKLMGLVWTSIQGFRRNGFDTFGMSCIKRSVVLSTIMIVALMVISFLVAALVVKVKTGGDFKEIMSAGQLFKVFLPAIIAIIVTGITSDMINKGMDQAEYGSHKGSASIILGSIQVIYAGLVIYAMVKVPDILNMLKEFSQLDRTVSDVLSPIVTILENAGGWALLPTLLSTICFGAVIFLHRACIVKLKKEYFHD